MNDDILVPDSDLAVMQECDIERAFAVMQELSEYSQNDSVVGTVASFLGDNKSFLKDLISVLTAMVEYDGLGKKPYIAFDKAETSTFELCYVITAVMSGGDIQAVCVIKQGFQDKYFCDLSALP